jgi:hypothetical protein
MFWHYPEFLGCAGNKEGHASGARQNGACCLLGPCWIGQLGPAAAAGPGPGASFALTMAIVRAPSGRTGRLSGLQRCPAQLPVPATCSGRGPNPAGARPAVGEPALQARARRLGQLARGPRARSHWLGGSEAGWRGHGPPPGVAAWAELVPTEDPGHGAEGQAASGSQPEGPLAP